MVKRSVYNLIKNTIYNKQIPLIIGLRRIGKTTILKQLESDLENSHYLSFDDFNFSDMKDKEFYNYLENLSKKYKFLLLDEVQSRNSWDQMLKSLFDKYLANNICNYVVTGSSSMNLSSKEMGVNRIKRIYLDTWDFDEYLDLTKKEKNFNNFEHFLGRGFPDYINSNKAFSEILDETLKPIIQNDIAKAYPQIDTMALSRLIIALANLSNGEVNESNLENKVGISRITIRKYINILEKASILKIVYRIDSRLIHSKKRQKKIYLNPHIHIWLLKKEFSTLHSKFKGHIIESYWLHWAKSINGWSKDFYYYKDIKSKEEIDFVTLNSDNSLKTIHEFKYSNNFNLNNTFNLLKANNKIVWCKETKDNTHDREISILDINNN